ncbi:MAG TPA: DUF4097 family beta strand repeat-containing protein [Chloroflexota bacterium]
MAENEQIVVEDFSVGPASELVVNTISGSVDIQGRDQHAIHMGATKRGSAQAVANTRVEYQQSGNRVQVQTKGEKGGLLNLARNISAVDYILTVPRDCRVRVETVSAEVRTRDLDHGVRIQTVSGEVTVKNVSGESQVTTVSGDATAQNVSGTLSLRTTSGDASVRGSQLSHFNLNSVSGDFAIETPLDVGQHYLARTVSGDLQLRLPSNSGATVQMRTVSGNVSSEIPADILRAGKRNWQGRINGGGATLEMNSVSGDLRILRSNGSSSTIASTSAQTGSFFPPAQGQESADLPGVVPEPAAAAVDSALSSTSEVLQALERGDISVEEALDRLNR